MIIQISALGLPYASIDLPVICNFVQTSCVCERNPFKNNYVKKPKFKTLLDWKYRSFSGSDYFLPRYPKSSILIQLLIHVQNHGARPAIYSSIKIQKLGA
jgi:hypothetical protein